MKKRNEFDMNKCQWVQVNTHMVNKDRSSSHYRDYDLGNERDVKILAESIDPQGAYISMLELKEKAEKQINMIKSQPLFNMVGVKSLEKERNKLLHQIADEEKKIKTYDEHLYLYDKMDKMTSFEKCVALYEYKLGFGIR